MYRTAGGRPLSPVSGRSVFTLGGGCIAEMSLSVGCFEGGVEDMVVVLYQAERWNRPERGTPEYHRNCAGEE